MKIFRTFTAVPPPDPKWLAIQAVTLVVYFGAGGAPVRLGGAEIAPINLALCVHLLLTFTRNAINRFPRPGLNRALAMALATYTGLLAISLVVLLTTPFRAMWITALLELTAAVAFLTALRLWPEDAHRLPSVWASRRRASRDAIALQQFGRAFFGLTLMGFALWGAPGEFALMLTLGALAFHLGVNWAVVLMLLGRDDLD